MFQYGISLSNTMFDIKARTDTNIVNSLIISIYEISYSGLEENSIVFALSQKIGMTMSASMPA